MEYPDIQKKKHTHTNIYGRRTGFELKLSFTTFQLCNFGEVIYWLDSQVHQLWNETNTCLRRLVQSWSSIMYIKVCGPLIVDIQTLVFLCFFTEEVIIGEQVRTTASWCGNDEEVSRDGDGGGRRKGPPGTQWQNLLHKRAEVSFCSRAHGGCRLTFICNVDGLASCELSNWPSPKSHA